MPWLVTVHATEYGRHQGWVDKHPQSHIHAVERRMVRGADRVITCSHYMRRPRRRRVRRSAPAKVTAIANGIDPTDLQPVADLPRLRARYAQPDEQLILLVGRLVYEKGFHLALDALPGLIERLGNVRFLVAGSGTAEAELKEQAKRLGLMDHGSFVGWTGDDELHSLYRIADLCVVPSIYEPFGLVALEAMASGCPCIVADTGGLREVVPGGGRVGLRFRPKRLRGRSARMAEQLLADDALRDRLVAEAREHVLGFDWADVARQTAEVYADLRGAAHDRVGADHRAGRDPRARPERRRGRRSARPSPTAIGAVAPAAGGSGLDVVGRCSASASTAQSPTARRRRPHRRQRHDTPPVADPRARADGHRPAGRLDPAALAEQAAVAEPHAAAVGADPAPRADAHVTAGRASRAPARAAARAAAARRARAARAMTASAPIRRVGGHASRLKPRRLPRQRGGRASPGGAGGAEPPRRPVARMSRARHSTRLGARADAAPHVRRGVRADASASARAGPAASGPRRPTARRCPTATRRAPPAAASGDQRVLGRVEVRRGVARRHHRGDLGGGEAVRERGEHRRRRPRRARGGSASGRGWRSATS